MDKPIVEALDTAASTPLDEIPAADVSFGLAAWQEFVRGVRGA